MDVIVSVVVPAKNEERFVARCLESILCCGHASQLLEVILVDNCSSDRTAEIARGLLGAHPNLRVITSHADTIAQVRMDGYRLCRGEVIGFIDSDSLVGPGWISKGLEILYESPEVSCVGFALSAPGADASWVERTWYPISSGSKWCNRQEVSWLSSFNLLIKRSFFDRVGGFDASLVTCEDADLGYRLSAISKVIFCDEVTVRHLGNVTTLKDFFFKELWRGKSNFTQFLASANKREHYRSVLAPLIYVVNALFLLSVAFTGTAGSLSLLLSIAFAVGLPLALSFRRGCRSFTGVVSTTVLFSIYLLARGVSIVRR